MSKPGGTTGIVAERWNPISVKIDFLQKNACFFSQSVIHYVKCFWPQGSCALWGLMPRESTTLKRAVLYRPIRCGKNV